MSKIHFLIAFVLLSLGEIVAQDYSKIIAKAIVKSPADSSYIAVNNRAGWQSLVSCLTSLKSDSVLLELVVKHDRTINMRQEHLVGRIKPTAMLPKTGQTISFYLISSIYQLRVEPDGRCYLRFECGTLPTGNQVIVPIRAIYKL